MRNVRRYYFPGAAVFITQNVRNRRPMLTAPQNVLIFQQTMEGVRQRHPFVMHACVLLPDHFHWIITPTGSSNFSKIMQSLKWNFTRNYKIALGTAESISFWQRRFWDHVIRDDRDLQTHLRYIALNPVKHGLCKRPEDWPYVFQDP
jgi:putative transposase